MARQVGRRGHDRPGERMKDRLRHRVGGNPQRDGLEPGGGQLRDQAARRLWQDQGQRPRPERVRQPHRIGIEAPDRLRRIEVFDMGDQRIERGAALGLVDPRDRGRIGGVGAEAIDGLGRERDQPASREAARGGVNARSPCGQNCRGQGCLHLVQNP